MEMKKVEFYKIHIYFSIFFLFKKDQTSYLFFHFLPI